MIGAIFAGVVLPSPRASMGCGSRTGGCAASQARGPGSKPSTRTAMRILGAEATFALVELKRKSRLEAGFRSTGYVDKGPGLSLETRDEPSRRRGAQRARYYRSTRNDPTNRESSAEPDPGVRLRKGLWVGCSPERAILPDASLVGRNRSVTRGASHYRGRRRGGFQHGPDAL